MMYYVYEHWRPDTNQCFYVGKGKGNRAYNMHKRNAHHKAITAKLRQQGFAVEVRIIKSGITEKKAFEIEILRIQFWKKSGINLVNMTLGGEGTSGNKAWNRKKVICLEDNNVFDSCVDAAKYYSIDLATLSEVCNGKLRSVKGLHFIFANSKNKTILEIESEHASRRKKVLKNKNNNEIVDGKDVLGRKANGPLKKSRPVVCLDHDLKFQSASSAARYYNVARSAVIEVCLGKNNRKSVGGLKFKYAECA